MGINKRGKFSDYLDEEEKNNKPEITRELLIRIFSWLKPYWKEMLLVVGTITVTSVLGIMPSILTGRIIDEGLIGKDINLLIKLIFISLGVTLLSNLIGVLESYINTWVGQMITYDMKTKMFRHLQKMPHEFFTGNSQGDIITRMTTDISGVNQLITGTLTSILSNIITLTVAMISMFQKNYILALTAIIIVPLFTLPTKKAGRVRWELTCKASENSDEINSILNEKLSVSGQLLVKLFNREEKEASEYERISKNIIKLNIRERMSGRWFRVILSTITSVGPMLIYLAGGLLMIEYGSSLTVGDITVLVSLLGRMYGPVNNLMGIEADWIRSMALFTRIFQYYDMDLKIKNAENPVIPKKNIRNISFENVSFSYSREKENLHNIDFSLDQGKRIAVVGPSGAGKSTLVNLLPRLYDVTEGSVKINGEDIRNIDLEWLRDNIGMVTQDTYLFNGTIKENLLYAKEDASMDELIVACRKANIFDFIRRQPDGFDTVVGNRGLKLSGGEKQRISIARVLLKNPSVLILDEATSSLDSISEKYIQEALDELIKTRTSIIIAHRLSTILNSDEILVMKEGNIVQRGSHSSLLEEDGIYKELYETQFKEPEEVFKKPA